MTEKEIYNECSSFLKKINYPLQPKTNLKDDLCLDSLDVAELIVHLEKKFHVEIDTDAPKRLETVQDLILLTQHCLKNKA